MGFVAGTGLGPDQKIATCVIWALQSGRRRLLPRPPVHAGQPRQQLGMYQLRSVVVGAVANARQEGKPRVWPLVGQGLEVAADGAVRGRKGVCIAPQNQQRLLDALQQKVGPRSGRACRGGVGRGVKGRAGGGDTKGGGGGPALRTGPRACSTTSQLHRGWKAPLPAQPPPHP